MKCRGLVRVTLALTLVVTVGVLLWFASPAPIVKAVNFTFTPSQPSGVIGSPVSFSVTIDVTNDDLLPIERVDLHIGDAFPSPTYGDHFQNLPIPLSPNTSTSTISIAGTSSTISVSATSGSGWGYGDSSGRHGYGYGYHSPTGSWLGWDDHPFSGNLGYGYSSGSFVGLTSIEYDITWTPPSNWPAGTYQITLQAWGDTDDSIIGSTSFTLSTGGGGGGGGFGGAGGLPVELRIDLMGLVDWHLVSFLGEVLEDIERTSADGRLTITLPVGTLARYEDGGVLLELITAINRNPPPLPEGTIIIGSAYTIEPDRASFSPPMIMTFNYGSVSEDIDEESLFVAYYNVDADRWISTGGVLDIEAKTISAEVRHLTTYALLAYIRPAAFMTSSLSISPAEVSTEQSVTISVLVGNTGALTGSYEVTLKVNFSVVETKSITLAGGASQKVIFTTTEDRTGDYLVDVNGLRGTFTVAEEGVLPEDQPDDEPEDQPEVPLAPADFTIDSLVISPIEVDVGKSVVIGVLVNNTGDLSGNYEVTLKIDNVVIVTKEVTVAGGTSQQVTFTTYADTAGTYSVDVNGLTETFTVEEKEEEVVTPAVEAGLVWWIWLIIGLSSATVVGLLLYFLRWRYRIA